MSTEPTPDQMARLVVTITKRDDGSILTDHRPMSDEDMATMMGWPTNGQVHVAQALATEAIRREARVMALVEMSKGKKAADLDPEEIEVAVRGHFVQLLDRAARVLTDSVLADLRGDGVLI